MKCLYLVDLHSKCPLCTAKKLAVWFHSRSCTQDVSHESQRFTTCNVSLYHVLSLPLSWGHWLRVRKLEVKIKRVWSDSYGQKLWQKPRDVWQMPKDHNSCPWMQRHHHESSLPVFAWSLSIDWEGLGWLFWFVLTSCWTGALIELGKTTQSNHVKSIS